MLAASIAKRWKGYMHRSGVCLSRVCSAAPIIKVTHQRAAPTQRAYIVDSVR